MGQAEGGSFIWVSHVGGKAQALGPPSAGLLGTLVGSSTGGGIAGTVAGTVAGTHME